MTNGKDLVININSKSTFRSVLQDIIDADNNNLLMDCVIMARRKFTKEEIELGEAEGNAAKIIRYWFGEDSSTECLGMVHQMAYVISNYIEGWDIINQQEV